MSALRVELDEQGFEAAVFEGTPAPRDWLRDITSRIPLLLLNFDDETLTRFVALRQWRLREYAILAFDRLIQAEDSRPEGFLLELHRLRNALEAGDALSVLAGVRISDTSSPHRDAIEADVVFEVQGLISERKLLRAEFDSEISQLDSTSAEHMIRARSTLEDAFWEEGAERDRLFREAKKMFAQQTGESASSHSPVAWLHYGWLIWRTDGIPEEAQPALSQALRSRISFSKRHQALAGRFMAFLLEADGDHKAAAACASKVADVCPSMGALLEAASYCATAGENLRARQFLSQALNLNSLSLFGGLADEALERLGSELLDGLLRSQLKTRQMARQQVSLWMGAIKKVSEAEELAGCSLRLPCQLRSDHADTSSTVQEADLIIATEIARNAENTRTELLQAAANSLQREYAKRFEAVEILKKGVDAALEVREARVRRALGIQQSAVLAARQTLVDSLGEGDKVQKGCLWGTGMGCGIFGLYMLVAVVLSFAGVELGMTSHLGTFVMGVALIPVAIAIVYQLMYSLKKIALDAEMAASVSRATHVYERTVLEADDLYRKQLVTQREGLSEAEDQLLKADDAIQMLNAA